MKNWTRSGGASVSRSAGVYITVCFAALQLLDMLSERMDLPNRFFVIAVILLVLGLPVVIAMGLLLDLRAEALRARSESGLRRWTRTAAHAATAAVVMLLAAAAFFLANTRRLPGVGAAALIAAAPEEGAARLLLAPFGSRTGDSAKAAVMTEALLADLQASTAVEPVVAHVPFSSLAGGAGDAHPNATIAIARELALREGTGWIVSGEVNRLGNSYVVTARVSDLIDSRSVAALREIAQDSTDLPRVLDRISQHVRNAATGVRQRHVIRTVQPENPVALQHLASGMMHAANGEMVAAERSVSEAVATAPDFARAQLELGLIRYCAGADSAAVAAPLTRAYEGRSRLTSPEWYRTLATYYAIVLGDSQRALAAERLAAGAQPDDAEARERASLLAADAPLHLVFCRRQPRA